MTHGRVPRRVTAALVLTSALTASTARADTVDQHLARVRELYDRRDFATAREELLAAYRLEPRPELLFALGQVELNLGHFARAIAYYEEFIATEPGSDQVALAQQAIGAARARLAEKPTPPRPPPHPVWVGEDTALTAFGATTMVIGGGLVIYGHHVAGDRSGTLSMYNDRLSRATILQWAGAGCLVAGALAIGGALVHWRLHLVDTEIQPAVAPGAAGVTWAGRW